MVSDDNTRVIGHFAYFPPMEAFCDGDACVIAGSKEALIRYLGTDESSLKPTIRKTRFGEILEGLRMGGAYAFDEQSYHRFYPLALKAGLSVGPEDFSWESPSGFRFVRISVEQRT